MEQALVRDLRVVKLNNFLLENTPLPTGPAIEQWPIECTFEGIRERARRIGGIPHYCNQRACWIIATGPRAVA